MSKNLIPEEDDDLVDETEGLGTSGKKGKDNEEDGYSDDFEWF